MVGKWDSPPTVTIEGVQIPILVYDRSFDEFHKVCNCSAAKDSVLFSDVTHDDQQSERVQNQSIHSSI